MNLPLRKIKRGTYVWCSFEIEWIEPHVWELRDRDGSHISNHYSMEGARGALGVVVETRLDVKEDVSRKLELIIDRNAQVTWQKRQIESIINMRADEIKLAMLTTPKSEAS